MGDFGGALVVRCGLEACFENILRSFLRQQDFVTVIGDFHKSF
jgi:hypothetical protein